MVAPFTGAWIEIMIGAANSDGMPQSLPLRGRGLKFEDLAKGMLSGESLPLRGRGLKY